MGVLWLTPEAPALWVFPNLQIFFFPHACGLMPGPGVP